MFTMFLMFSCCCLSTDCLMSCKIIMMFSICFRRPRNHLVKFVLHASFISFVQISIKCISQPDFGVYLTDVCTILLVASRTSPPLITPEAPPSPAVADSPSQNLTTAPLNIHHHSYHITLIPALGIAVTVVAVIVLVVLVFLIRRKSKELEDCDNIDNTSSKAFPPPRSVRKFQEGKVLGLSQLHLLSCC